MITLIARTDPLIPCSVFLSDSKWTVLVLKVFRNNILPKEPPTVADAVKSIAMLGGYLDRKNDAPPGMFVLWRVWKRLIDLTEGWNLACRINTCG